jgi:hypothetical protein
MPHLSWHGAAVTSAGPSQSDITQMHELNHTYSTSPVEIRRAIDCHREWIEASLGVPLSEAVVIETDLSLYNAALPRLIGYADRYAPVTPAIARLTERLESVETPNAHVPIIDLTRERAVGVALGQFAPTAEESCAYSMEWVDGPVLLRVRDLSVPIVALCVRYHAGPDSSSENQQDLVVTPRRGVESVMSLLKTLTRVDGRPRLKVGHGGSQMVTKCGWDQLVLDQSIVSLLQSDFESFFGREDWFRKMRLPFRRGYLLHGPPGNGKSTAVRAMLTSRGLTAYTMRFFHPQADDDDLDRVFARAAENAPAMVLLEDIDRVFPRTGESNTKVSLQQLLNCLDGVGSGEGIIVVATANEPTALDPAILHRPGRFDRVVLFPNPTPELRRDYFSKLQPSLAEENLSEVVEESKGFSFAQLRECYIMAAQASFSDNRELTADDLVNGVWAMRRTILFGSLKSSSAGFAAPIPIIKKKQK